MCGYVGVCMSRREREKEKEKAMEGGREGVCWGGREVKRKKRKRRRKRKCGAHVEVRIQLVEVIFSILWVCDSNPGPQCLDPPSYLSHPKCYFK